ncbi:phage portal protein family protein [Microbacterium sp.]|uniref:phage portal protein family protein n=1 Tax=Microbacterium sp. TaxID=51671 RepID=UPI003F723B1F
MAEIGYQATGGLLGWAGMLSEVVHEDNPDLMWPASIDVYDRMRREDPQVGSVLQAVMRPIQQVVVTLDAAGVRPEVAQQISDDLGIAIKGQPFVAPARTKGRFSWTEHVRLALLMLVFGHAFFEQVFEIDAFGRTRLQKLAYRPPRTISEFEIERDGGLAAIKQHPVGLTTTTGVVAFTTVGGIRIPVNRLVGYVNEREGANWMGVSILRTAYKMWLLKDRTLRVQALAADRQGLGLPIYTSPPPPDLGDQAAVLKWMDEEIERGLVLAKGSRAGDTAGASLPNGATLTFQGVAGKLPDLDKQIRYYDEQIGRVALTHFLNLGGDDSKGSYALGDTFAKFFTGSLNAIAEQIVSTTQQHVVEDLVDANWGPAEPAPRLVAAPIGAEHPATAEAIKALLESGAIKWDPTLEAHLRALYGLPVVDATRADEDEKSAAEKALAAAAIAQKAYLATDRPPLTRREVRALIAAGGAVLDVDAPEEMQEAS